MVRVRIENVVASTSLGADLDLNSVAQLLEGSEYAPDRFPGVIYRLKEPRTAVLVFHSGKLVCTGGRSWAQIDASIRIVSQRIREGGAKILRHPAIQIQNIVATSDLGSEIDLNRLAVTLGLDRVEYEPEQFPGLVYRVEEPRVVMLLFASGKLVCTGARRPMDIEVAVKRVTAELDRGGLLTLERRRAFAKPTPSGSGRVAGPVPHPPRSQVPAAPVEIPSLPAELPA